MYVYIYVYIFWCCFHHLIRISLRALLEALSAYIHTYTYVSTCIHKHVFMYIYRYVCMYISMYISMFMYLYIYVYVFIYICEYSYMYVCIVLFMHLFCKLGMFWCLCIEDNYFSEYLTRNNLVINSLPNTAQFPKTARSMFDFLWRQPQILQDVTLVARRGCISGVLGLFLVLLNFLQKRWFSTQEISRYLSTVSSQRRATRIDTSLLVVIFLLRVLTYFSSCKLFGIELV